MTVRDFVTELLNFDLDSQIEVRVSANPQNQKITVFGNEITEVLSATGVPGEKYTIVEMVYGRRE